jgi:hypothetical protein
MGKKRTTTTKRNAATQGEKPGYGKPPVEHQFQPGQSGNPNGPPKGRTHLWTYICKFMAMTPEQLRKVKRDKLTVSQRTALRIVLDVQRGKGCGAERFMRYAVDREEGKAVEHLIIDDASELTDEECEELRKLIRQKHGRNAD